MSNYIKQLKGNEKEKYISSKFPNDKQTLKPKIIIKEDIIYHAIDLINDYIDTEKDDLHHHLYNEDYFIVGYYKATQWLEKNNISQFEAIGFCNEMEKEHFGEIQTTFEDNEKLVNHFAYWQGQELIYNLDCYNDLNNILTKKDIKTIIKELNKLLIKNNNQQ